VVSFGAAIDQMPVTKAVVIKTTNTQPSTSARLFDLINFLNEYVKYKDNLSIMKLLNCV
jgi:hypothetical protein